MSWDFNLNKLLAFFFTAQKEVHLSVFSKRWGALCQLSQRAGCGKALISECLGRGGGFACFWEPLKRLRSRSELAFSLHCLAWPWGYCWCRETVLLDTAFQHHGCDIVCDPQEGNRGSKESTTLKLLVPLADSQNAGAATEIGALHAPAFLFFKARKASTRLKPRVSAESMPTCAKPVLRLLPMPQHAAAGVNGRLLVPSYTTTEPVIFTAGYREKGWDLPNMNPQATKSTGSSLKHFKLQTALLHPERRNMNCGPFGRVRTGNPRSDHSLENIRNLQKAKPKPQHPKPPTPQNPQNPETPNTPRPPDTPDPQKPQNPKPPDPQKPQNPKTPKTQPGHSNPPSVGIDVPQVRQKEPEEVPGIGL